LARNSIVTSYRGIGLPPVAVSDSQVQDCIDHDFDCNDCSGHLNGRTVRFESNYNPGKMIDNDCKAKFVNRDKIMEPDERVSWKLHACGNGYLAMESQSPRHNYLQVVMMSAGPGGLVSLKYKSHSPCNVEKLKTRICCQDCGNMHKCRILSKDYRRQSEDVFLRFGSSDSYRVYPSQIYADNVYRRNNGVERKFDCRKAEWKVWLELPRDDYVVDKTSMCNRLSTDEKFGYEMTETVTKGSSHTVRDSVATEVRSELLQALQLGGSGVTYTRVWERMTSLQESHSRTIKVGGLQGLTVRPNKRVVIKRLVAYYGEYVYKTNNFIIEEQDC